LDSLIPHPLRRLEEPPQVLLGEEPLGKAEPLGEEGPLGELEPQAVNVVVDGEVRRDVRRPVGLLEAQAVGEGLLCHGLPPVLSRHEPEVDVGELVQESPLELVVAEPIRQGPEPDPRRPVHGGDEGGLRHLQAGGPEYGVEVGEPLAQDEPGVLGAP